MPASYAGFWVRVAAGVYDALLLIALWIAATAVLMPFSHGAIHSGTHWYQLYLLVVAFPFFGWFWTHGGQTLGMRAWRLRVFTRNGTALTWRHALLRYLAAVVGVGACAIGLLWCLIDPDKRALQDIVSGTRVLRMPKGTADVPRQRA